MRSHQFVEIGTSLKTRKIALGDDHEIDITLFRGIAASIRAEEKHAFCLGFPSNALRNLSDLFFSYHVIGTITERR